MSFFGARDINKREKKTKTEHAALIFCEMATYI